MSSSASAQRGQILLDQGRYPEAEKYFRDTLAENPNDPLALYFLAVCQLRQDNDLGALQSIDRALSLDPEIADFHAFRAFALAALSRSGEALKSADESIRLHPESDEAWCARAAAFLSSNEWAKAETAARQALHFEPDNPTAAAQLAHALRLQNRLSESSDQAEYMLSKDPEDPHVRVTIGWTELQRGNHRKAEEHFLEALRLDAGNGQAREGLKEAFRARSPLYRAYLNYCFFLARFTSGKQWMIIIGLIVVVKILPILLPLYLIFVLWVHIARPVGNLQLGFDRFAKHALEPREKIEAWIVGGAVVVGLTAFAGGLIGGNPAALTLGITLIGASFPFAYTFLNESPGRYFFGAVGVYVLAAVGAASAKAAGLLPDLPAIKGAGMFAVLAVVSVTWLSNVRALNSRA